MAEIRYTESVEIAAPIERVFAYRLDFMTLGEYNPNVSNLRQTAGDDPGVGAEYVFDLALPGAPDPIQSPLRVVEVEEPTRIVLETGPGYMARETCTFTGGAEGTTVVFDTILTFPGDIDEATADMVRTSGSEQNRLELDLMKKILET